MRRQIYISVFAILFLTNTVSAQNMYDAINFGTNDYFGSARSLAIGNAVTAIGGDLGTIGINPAGSAVANYGQLTFTVGTNTSMTKADLSLWGDNEIDFSNKSNLTKLSIPNIGTSCVLFTGADSGLKSLSFAVTINQTANYTNHINSYGVNGLTTKIGEMAAAASGIDPEIMGDYNSFYNSDVSWDLLTAYQGGLFSRVLDTYDYAGVTEGVANRADNSLYMYNAGDLNQSSIVTRTGSKNDMILNMGANFSDKFYLGVNIGMPYATYSSTESFYESAVNPDQFATSFQSKDGTLHTTNFVSARNNYQYVVDMDGIYAKIGLLYTNSGLRIGAAFQTSSLLSVNEKWKYYSSVNYSSSNYNGSQESPVGEYSYILKTPYIANLGIAYTLGQAGFVSLDYEIADYKSMSFRDLNSNYSFEDSFQDVNSTIKNFSGLGKSLRIGAEFRLSPSFALRAGYNFNSIEEYYYIENGAEVYASDYQSNYASYANGSKKLAGKSKMNRGNSRISCGLGYSSLGSFFMDLAVSITNYPNSDYAPYYPYTAFDSQGVEVATIAPRITSTNKLFNAVLTLGWRF